MMGLGSKAARLGALGLDEEEVLLDGTARGVGVCRSCHHRVALIRGVWCPRPKCGSALGVQEMPE